MTREAQPNTAALAATECSHGRQAVGEYPQQFEPHNGEKLFRHSVARMTSKSQTTAFGRGYILSPLTRLKAHLQFIHTFIGAYRRPLLARLLAQCG